MSDRTLPVHAPSPRPPGPDPRRWWALVLLCLAQFMVILDITVVNVALPTIGSDLQLDRTSLTWVVTAYTLCFGGLLLLGGRLADTLGRRRIFLTGLGLFTAASLASGLAQGGTTLISARAGQGVGAAVGVLAGGLLVEYASWRWVFFINLPVGVLVAAAVPALIAAVRPAHWARRLDLLGALAGTLAIAAVIYGLVTAGSDGWGATATLLSLAIGLVLAGGVRRRRADGPAAAGTAWAAGPPAPAGRSAGHAGHLRAAAGHRRARRGLWVATTTAMAHVDHDQAGLTSGLLSTGHELGASLGVAVVSTIAAASLTSDPLAGRPPFGGFDRGFLASALVAAGVAAAAGWLLPPGRPRHRPPHPRH